MLYARPFCEPEDCTGPEHADGRPSCTRCCPCAACGQIRQDDLDDLRAMNAARDGNVQSLTLAEEQALLAGSMPEVSDEDIASLYEDVALDAHCGNCHHTHAPEDCPESVVYEDADQRLGGHDNPYPQDWESGE